MPELIECMVVTCFHKNMIIDSARIFFAVAHSHSMQLRTRTHKTPAGVLAFQEWIAIAKWNCTTLRPENGVVCVFATKSQGG